MGTPCDVEGTVPTDPGVLFPSTSKLNVDMNPPGSLGTQRTRLAGLRATVSEGGGREWVDRWIKGEGKEGRTNGVNWEMGLFKVLFIVLLEIRSTWTDRPVSR